MAVSFPTLSRSTCARTPGVATPAPRDNLTLAPAHALAVPRTPDVATLTLAHFPAWRQRSSRTPEPGIQDVAEGVAEQVRAEHGEADRDPGEEHQVRCLLCVLGGRDGEHAPPRRVRLGHAEPRNDNVASTRIALPS